MQAQFFKANDETEKKFYRIGEALFDELSLQKDLFFDQAFSCFILGDLIWDSGRAPLSNAIPKNIFRESFTAIFENFLYAGSLESYISVFKDIFGDDVSVQFEIPTPGKLVITIQAAGTELSNFAVRRIENNTYFFDQVVTRDGDHIMLRTIKGMESQYEVEQMLFELVSGGIYTEINLTIGGS